MFINAYQSSLSLSADLPLNKVIAHFRFKQVIEGALTSSVLNRLILQCKNVTHYSTHSQAVIRGA